MDDLEQPSVITAIADAEFEGMVSSAIFASGWDVIARPLDFATLANCLDEQLGRKVLVIYSVDLPGFSDEQLRKYSRGNSSFIGFTDAAGSARGFGEVSPRPVNRDELLAYIRGNIRSPLLRAPLIQSRPNFKAKIIAIGSAGSHTGATTLALNLAQELSLAKKKTLLLDANFSSPEVAALLDLRKVADEDKWRDISDYFSVAEVTQRWIPEFTTKAAEAAGYFDCLVIDLGSLLNITNDLSDRRWTSQAKIWASRFADEIFITSGSDFLQQIRLRRLCSQLYEVKLPTRISIFITPSADAVKRDRSKPVNLQPLIPEKVEYLPFDPRLCGLARAERTTFSEINGKAPLRKAIATIAGQITG
jgi:hypothetical protein